MKSLKQIRAEIEELAASIPYDPQALKDINAKWPSVIGVWQPVCPSATNIGGLCDGAEEQSHAE